MDKELTTSTKLYDWDKLGKGKLEVVEKEQHTHWDHRSKFFYARAVLYVTTAAQQGGYAILVFYNMRHPDFLIGDGGQNLVPYSCYDNLIPYLLPTRELALERMRPLLWELDQTVLGTR